MPEPWIFCMWAGCGEMRKILGKIGSRRPVNLIVLADLFAFSLLSFYRKSFDAYMVAAALMVIVLIVAVHFLLVRLHLGDEYLFLITAMLTSLGFIMIYRLDRELGLKQIIWFLVGILAFFATCLIFMKIRGLNRFMFYYTAAALALFALTLLLGRSIKGSTNWITMAGHNFQPSELIKILFVLALACCYGGKSHFLVYRHSITIERGSLLQKLYAMGTAYSFIGLLIIQRDWGMSTLLFLVYIGMLFIFENDWKLYAVNGILAAAAALGGYLLLSHIRVRVDMWLNPWDDLDGKGYQITQSLFAIASGGFFGTGIGLGNPDMIPEVANDFIFSAICEEMGIFGGVAVILLYFILCYRGFKLALKAHNAFDRAVAAGITAMFGIQTFIIIGGVIKLIPMTGVTLPFVSYGGSSLTTSFMALGILQAVSAGTAREEREGADGPG